MMVYHPRDYFGELSLIKDHPRDADVKATTDCCLLVLERAAFERLLGPLESILGRPKIYSQVPIGKPAAAEEANPETGDNPDMVMGKNEELHSEGCTERAVLARAVII